MHYVVLKCSIMFVYVQWNFSDTVLVLIEICSIFLFRQSAISCVVGVRVLAYPLVPHAHLDCGWVPECVWGSVPGGATLPGQGKSANRATNLVLIVLHRAWTGELSHSAWYDTNVIPQWYLIFHLYCHFCSSYHYYYQTIMTCMVVIQVCGVSPRGSGVGPVWQLLIRHL